MKRVVCLVLVLALAWGSLGCYTMKHTVGTGPQTGVKSSDRQWFILFGLVPLGRTDSKDVAGGSENYRVTTKFGVVDILLNIFTGLLTIESRTIIVER
jgi:hypothetical protein